MKKRKLFIFLFAMFFLFPLMAQIQTPIKFKTELKSISETEAEIIFEATIDAGWHLYSTDLPEDGPISTTLTMEKLEGSALVWKLTPRGNVLDHSDYMFELNLRSFATA